MAKRKTFIQTILELNEKSYINLHIIKENENENDNVEIQDCGFSITFLEEFIPICKKYKKLFSITVSNYEGCDLTLRTFERLYRSSDNSSPQN